MIDIVLINTPISSGKKPYDISSNLSKSLNFGLLSIASYLSSKGFSSYVFDPRSSTYDTFKQIYQIIDYYTPPVVGLSCISGFSYTSFKMLANDIKSKYSNILLIAGGKDHIGIIDNQVMLECQNIDVLVKGEGEDVVAKILYNYHMNKSFETIPNIVYRSHKGVCDTSDFKERTLNYIPKLDYNLHANFFSHAPSIEVSRGCPYNCAFCISSRDKIINKEMDIVFEEASSLCDIYQKKDLKIYFETPIFLHSTDELKRLAQLRSEWNSQFTWRTETRVDFLTTQNITLLKNSGAKVLDIGLESTSPEILLRMNKTNSPEKYIKHASTALINAHNNGITLKINILFYIGENLNTLRETYNFLASHSEYIRAISAYPMLIYPGMGSLIEFEKELEKHGGSIIKKSPWNERKIFPVNLSSELSYSQAEELALLFGKAFQTMENYFYQKQFGYFPPNYNYSDFKSHVNSIGIAHFPFSATQNETTYYKSLLENKLQISNKTKHM